MANVTQAMKKRGLELLGDGLRGITLAAALWSVCLCLVGCQVVKETAKLPGQTIAAVIPGEKPAPPDPAVLQGEVLRYADDFMSRTASGVDDYIHLSNSREARDRGLRWRLALESSALGIATGPNPMANLVDFLALSTLTREFLEQKASRAVPADKAFDSWMENSRVAETNAWLLAEGILTPEQTAELRTTIEHWRANSSQDSESFFERPQKFAVLIRQTADKQTQVGSIFGLVGLDPTAGLDPAVREVTRTRLFAERGLFAVQRMPFLVRWQVELLVDQVFRQERLGDVITSADRLSRAAEAVSRTAEQLPDRITIERKAILAALEAQEGRLHDLSAEVSRTLVAGDKMSTSLNTTIISFDALMKRFGVGEPSTTPPDTNSPPFNILDYARTAEQIATMAQQLDLLLKDTRGTVDTPALDQRIAQLNALSGKARADAKSVLNHAFLLLSLLLLLGFACALTYRRLTAQRKTLPSSGVP